jgi:hypothetical protein
MQATLTSSVRSDFTAHHDEASCKVVARGIHCIKLTATCGLACRGSLAPRTRPRAHHWWDILVGHRRRQDVEKLTDRLNAPVQGTGADGLKLALALLWERRSECPGAVPVLVCHDEVVVECTAEQAADVKVWLEKAMIEGMEAALSGTDEVGVPVEAEARIARNWGEGTHPRPPG